MYTCMYTCIHVYMCVQMYVDVYLYTINKMYAMYAIHMYAIYVVKCAVLGSPAPAPLVPI